MELEQASSNSNGSAHNIQPCARCGHHVHSGGCRVDMGHYMKCLRINVGRQVQASDVHGGHRLQPHRLPDARYLRTSTQHASAWNCLK